MKKLNTHKLMLLAGLLTILPTASSFALAETSNAIVKWDQTALQAIRDIKPGPPMTARALAIVNTCMYDAWANYDNKAAGTMFGNTLRRPKAERTEANKTKAISFAAYKALVDLFPTKKSSFDAAMLAQGFNPNDVSVDLSTPSGLGNATCAAVLDMRHHDGSNQLGDLAPGAYSDYTGYEAVNSPTQIIDPNHWQPLIVNGVKQPFLGAQWFAVKPFALTSADQFRPAKGPAQYGTAAYLEQAKIAISYNTNLTEQQKVIAEYWADGPNSEFPPGHWILIGINVSDRDHHSIDDDAKMFFAIANAMHDAAIVAWEAKRATDYVRPITAIHYLFANDMIIGWAGPGLGNKLMLGSEWQTYQATNFNTPPFPEYFSGHSCFSAAGAQILRSFTKSDVYGGSYLAAAGSSRVEPGLVPATNTTLSWGTFTDAADEAGMSRRYGGIHFVQGDLDARAAGKKVGALVWSKANRYFNGNVSPASTASAQAAESDAYTIE